MKYLFSDKFSLFDMLSIVVVIEIAQTYGLWWLLAIIPLTFLGAIFSIKYEQ